MNINFVSLIFVVTMICFVTGGETLRHRCIHDQIAVSGYQIIDTKMMSVHDVAIT